MNELLAELRRLRSIVVGAGHSNPEMLADAIEILLDALLEHFEAEAARQDEA